MQFCFLFFQISKNTIQDIDQRVRRISNIARKYYSKTELEPLDILETKTDDTIRMMMELRSSMNCERIHMWVQNIFFSYQTCLLFFVDVYFFNKPVSIFLRSYNTALVSVCDSGLLGIIILLITSAVSGFLFTTLVWCNSHTWIYFKHKGRYIKVRE